MKLAVKISVIVFFLFISLANPMPANRKNDIKQIAPDVFGTILELCPLWLARLPGGCSRFLRVKRSGGKKPFCGSWRPICPDDEKNF